MKEHLARVSLVGCNLEYLDRNYDGIDDKESARDFLQSVEAFLTRKAGERATLRDRLNTSASLPRLKRRKTGARGKGEYKKRILSLADLISISRYDRRICESHS